MAVLLLYSENMRTEFFTITMSDTDVLTIAFHKSNTAGDPKFIICFALICYQLLICIYILGDLLSCF